VALLDVGRRRQGIIREAQVARIVKMPTGKTVIILAEIRQEILHAEINLYAIVNPMNVLPWIRVDNKIWAVAYLNIEPIAQLVVKEIVVLDKTGPQIAKIKANF
jgi:hypothetical protein